MPTSIRNKSSQRQVAPVLPVRKTAPNKMNVEQTDTGGLDDFRRGQLRDQVVHHLDSQLPPLTNASKAEEMIRQQGRFPGTGVPVTPEVVAVNQPPLKEPSALTFRNIRNPSRLLQEPPKKDQKMADVLINEPQRMQALSKALPGSTMDPAPGAKSPKR